MKRPGLLGVVTMLVLALACESRNPATPSSADGGIAAARSASAAPAADRPTDAWLGRWLGPEGTYLLLTRDGEKYAVKIQSLDGPASYEGVGAGDRIQFVRQGKTEFIRAGSGAETGMKWLLEKNHCLIIKTGEGFCRD